MFGSRNPFELLNEEYSKTKPATPPPVVSKPVQKGPIDNSRAQAGERKKPRNDYPIRGGNKPRAPRPQNSKLLLNATLLF